MLTRSAFPHLTTPTNALAYLTASGVPTEYAPLSIPATNTNLQRPFVNAFVSDQEWPALPVRISNICTPLSPDETR